MVGNLKNGGQSPSIQRPSLWLCRRQKGLAAELARREPWLSSNSLHPGVFDTKLLHAGFDMQGASVHSGAKTSVYLATSTEVKGISGQYFDDCKVMEPLAAVNDVQLAKQLWAWSEQAIARVHEIK